ncbi:POP5 ribonuclease P/MRP subunit isoform X2 [Calliopsis andreniformis]|uniref:POP5 ribonuclease P/MRP subunit isoform X2 n=1 Tax=Calliopsis andreniformis TaxID=337506 RepID=UPI003FCDCD64
MVRFKNRYIAFEITLGDKSDKPFPLKITALHVAIQQKIQQLYGDFGVAAIKAGFTAKYCNVHTKIALVKTRHGPHKFLLGSIPFITDIAGRLVSAKKYQQKRLEQTWNSLRTDMERKSMENALMSLTPAMKDFT